MSPTTPLPATPKVVPLPTTVRLAWFTETVPVESLLSFEKSLIGEDGVLVAEPNLYKVENKLVGIHRFIIPQSIELQNGGESLYQQATKFISDRVKEKGYKLDKSYVAHKRLYSHAIYSNSEGRHCECILEIKLNEEKQLSVTIQVRE